MPGETSREVHREDAEKNVEKNDGFNFPKFIKNNNLHIQEAYRIPSRINTQRTANRHTKEKMLKVKDEEEILKTTREK